MLVLGEQTNLIFIRENLYRIVATRWARSAAVEMLSRPAILLPSFVILLSDRRGLWEQLWLSINLTLVKAILEDRPTLIELLPRCVGKYLGGRRILHFICRVDFGAYGWAGTCVWQFCCVPPGTFSPWRLRYREADRCSLPTIAETWDERNENGIWWYVDWHAQEDLCATHITNLTFCGKDILLSIGSHGILSMSWDRCDDDMDTIA